MNVDSNILMQMMEMMTSMKNEMTQMKQTQEQQAQKDATLMDIINNQSVDLRSKDAQITSMNTTINNQMNNIHNLTADNIKKEGQIELKDKEIERKDGEIKEKDKEIERKDGEIKQKDGEIKQKSKEIEQKSDEIKGLRDDKNKLRSTAIKAIETAQKLEKEKNEAIDLAEEGLRWANKFKKQKDDLLDAAQNLIQYTKNDCIELYNKDDFNKVTIVSNYLCDSQKKYALYITKEALEKFDYPQKSAAYIVNKFNSKYGGRWDCIISLRNYLGAEGSYIEGHMIAFAMGQYFVLIKKNM
ncbi:hypothetical protein M9Y10_034466 [Tritrichomonas musculus]|uniref:Dynein light chain n=1 Tax=Tritrichomonas musculus TaxID=1915356 RepID=A0ABR2KFW8_9EUKA